MRRSALICAALLFSSAAWQLKAEIALVTAANPVVEYSTSSIFTDERPFTIGYAFTTSVIFDIDALGYFDDGLGNAHQVGLWNSAGDLLASATVLGTDPVTGHFRYSPMEGLVLAPGSYVIGGEFLGSGNPFPGDASGVVTLPGYTYLTDEQIYGSGLNFPTVATGGAYGDNGILAVNFSVASSTAVPEPSSAALLGIMLAALACVFGRRFRTV